MTTYEKRLIELSDRLVELSQPLRKSEFPVPGTEALLSHIDYLAGYISSIDTKNYSPLK